MVCGLIRIKLHRERRGELKFKCVTKLVHYQEFQNSSPLQRKVFFNITTFQRKSTFSISLRKVGKQEQEVQIMFPVHAKSVSSISNKVRCNAFIGPEGGAGAGIIMVMCT